MIDEIKKLVERYEQCVKRIKELNTTLFYLSEKNEHIESAKCKLYIQQGLIDPVPPILVSKDLARPLYEAELSKVKIELAEIEKKLSGIDL